MNPSNDTRAIPSSSPKTTLHVSSTSSARTDGVPMPPRATAFARADAPSLLHRTTASARANASPRATVSTQMNGVGQLCTPMTARTDAPPVLLRIPSVIAGFGDNEIWSHFNSVVSLQRIRMESNEKYSN